MARRSPSKAARRRNRRLSRVFVYLAYAGTAIVALAQVIAALGQIVGFLHRVLGALGDGAVAGIMVGIDAPPRAAMIRSPAVRPGRVRRRQSPTGLGAMAGGGLLRSQ
jgi:hypothetical protein